jgi:hypothetical protein
LRKRRGSFCPPQDSRCLEANRDNQSPGFMRLVLVFRSSKFSSRSHNRLEWLLDQLRYDDNDLQCLESDRVAGVIYARIAHL